MVYRTGIGYDVHALKKGIRLMIGGVEIPHSKGCIAHSDGDVLIHAICDALLGAAALGDIGRHFPDTSDEYKGIDSKILLQKTLELLNSEGYSIGNIDSTICIQHPKLQNYIPEMRRTIAKTCRVDSALISVKATTTEGLGFVGKEEGIAAYATVLIIGSKF